MTLKILTLSLSLFAIVAQAQTSTDPIVMKVNGQPVTRSEFEYSYRKNNSEGVVERKSVKDYVDLFVNYKLKVEAAKAARLDTMTSFRSEFSSYRDQQVRPDLITEKDLEAKARQIYDNARESISKNGGMVQASHILLLLKQDASNEEKQRAQTRIDSIYNALRAGADFAKLAKQCSQDRGSAQQGGDLQWLVKGQTFKEFEEQLWALKDGEMSKPFLSPAGWHILLRRAHQPFFSYESQRKPILDYIDQMGIREQVIDEKIDTLATQQHTTKEAILAQKLAEKEAKDPNLKYLVQEYHDGLLLFEISNREVWEKARLDSVGLENYFRKHRKQYKWDTPRFKGIAYYTRYQDDVKAVKKVVKKLPFSQWAKNLRSTFNADSLLRIQVVQGLFKKGDDELIDQQVFGVDTVVKGLKEYPYPGVYGKKLSRPQELNDVRELVLADYQGEMERQWVATLRRIYPVEVYPEVLATIKEEK